MKTEFASVKLSRPFVVWLKQQSARRGIPMYELVEELVSRGQKRFWRPDRSPADSAAVAVSGKSGVP